MKSGFAAILRKAVDVLGGRSPGKGGIYSDEMMKADIFLLGDGMGMTSMTFLPSFGAAPGENAIMTLPFSLQA